ncbi:SPOR domain-containing protein [Halioxenophilus aromaticivorans]|uniref:SPOR domain-containing protein n=1 Tax=Halioxenophilus aromaticivorans TaxID=1306992 RepID=A0AAV3U0M0_9ALTE
MSHDPVVNDALTELGLSGSPFTPGDCASADFISPLRENQVQRAAHLCRYGDQLLVVVGGKGAGKTFFLTKLSLDLAEIPQLVMMDAADYAEAEDEFWAALVAQLGAQSLSMSDSVGAQIAAIRKHLAQCEDPPVLLLDNAEAFSDQVLAVLLSLMSSGAQESALKSVLAGSSKLVERLDALNNIEVMIYDLELAVVTVEQWQNFCDIQLRLYGLSGDSPITEDVLEGIISDAGINVRKIFEQLDDQLREERVTSIPEKGSLGLPPMHLALIVGLVVCLLLMVLVGERLFGGEEPATAPTFEKQADVVVYDSKGSAAQAANEAKIAQDMASDITKQDASNLDYDANGSDSVQPIIANRAAEAEPQVAAEVSQAITEAINEQSEAVAEPLVTGQAQQGTPIASGNATEATPEQDIRLVPPEQAQPVESAPAPSARAPSSINDLPDGRYVLQILAASKAEGLQAFVDDQSNRDSLRIAEIKRGSGSWFVLLQGNYASPEAARSAVKYLPKDQQKDGVWPRKTEDIKRILIENQ